MNAGHRRRPVVTEPEAADEIAGQSDEQRVLVARRRSGFSIDQSMDGVGRARRAAFHRPAQILEHRRGGARRHHPRRLLCRRHAEHVALGADDGDEKTDLRQQAVVFQGGIGSRQFHRRGVDAADGHERRRAGRSDLEPLDDIVEPLAEAHGDLGPGAVARLRESEIESDGPPAQAAAIGLRRPVRPPQRAGRDEFAHAHRSFTHADQREQLAGRSDRAGDVGGAIPRPAIAAGAGDGQHLSGRAHEEAGRLVLAGNRADLGRQVALKFAVHVDDEAIVRGEFHPACPRLSEGEVAIGSIFQPRINIFASPQSAGDDAALELLPRRLRRILRDLVLREHEIDDLEPAVQGGAGVLLRVSIVGLRQHADEKRRLGQRQVLHAHPEIIPRRVVEAVHVARMRHDIHVASENFRPRQPRGNSHRKHGFEQFALKAVLLLEEQGSCELLRERAAALAVAQDILPSRTRGRTHLQRAVRKEALVLAGDHRILEHLREFVGAESGRANHVLGHACTPACILDLTRG